MSETGQPEPPSEATPSQSPAARAPQSRQAPATSAELPAFASVPTTRRNVPPLTPSLPLPQVEASELAARLKAASVSTNSPASTEPLSIPPQLPEFVIHSQPQRPPKAAKSKRGLRVKRLAVFGIGLGLLAGTFARGRDRADATQDAAATGRPATAVATVMPAPTPPPPPELKLEAKAEIGDLQQRLQVLAAETDNLRLGAVLYDVDSGAHASISKDETFPTASTIKVPILVAIFEAVDEGRIQLDETLTLRQDLIASGSGTLQSQSVGTTISVLEAATLAISISDNTATNLLIDRLGGIEPLNQRFHSWGMTHTRLVALLPDLGGTNVTSPVDLTLLLEQIEKGALLSRRSRDRLLDIMRRTQNDSLLPQGLGPQARIAHKTGNIRALVGDMGIIDLPNGRRYIAAVMVQRATPNDPAAERLIQQVSQTARDYWTQ